ncbi:hypothetical protein ABTD55_23270, partial [Acinetobacter baumannii]
LAAGQADARNWRARAGEAARRIADMAKREEALREESAVVAARPAGLDARIAALEADHLAARARAEAAALAEREAEAALRT